MSQHTDEDGEPILEQLRTAAARASGKSATKSVIQAAADLFAEALSSQVTPPAELLRIHPLSPRVAGRGYAKAWNRMDHASRQRALDALENAEKALRARALLIVAEELLAEDPKVAVRALSLVLGSKEALERLPSILQERQHAIQALSARDIVAAEFWTVLEAALSATQGNLARRGPFFALIRVGVRSLDDADRRADAGADRFVSWLRVSLPTQPEQFLRELPPLLGSRGDLLGALGLRAGDRAEAPGPEQVRSVPSGGTALASHTPPAVASSREPQPRPPTREQLGLLHDWAEAQRARASAIDEVLEWTQHAVRRLDEGAKALAEEQERHHETLARVASLEVRLGELEKQRSGLEAELQSAARERSEQWGREREDLLARIEKTATTRLQHFRDRLANSLRRELTEPLPTEGHAVSEALGAVLLSRLHGVLRVLRGEGIDAKEM